MAFDPDSNASDSVGTAEASETLNYALVVPLVALALHLLHRQ